MESCRSPLAVFRRAHELGSRPWPTPHASRFSRKTFTRAQLFACLALREYLGLSYRDAQAFLADVPAWLAAAGMARAPDHNTLWRAFGTLLRPGRTAWALDLLAGDRRGELNVALRVKPLSIDATYLEPRHRSRHYDRVCRTRGEDARRPGKWGRSVNRARRRRVRRLPKLALATAAATRQVLAARATLGAGSDAPDFGPLLYDAWRRAAVRTVVADAGYDSEANHRLARLDLNVRSVIAVGIGRPSAKPPGGYYRRLMKQRFKNKADAKVYGQRSQSETANSMLKRNLGSELRSVDPTRQKQELMLRAIVHNLMLPPPGTRGSRLSLDVPFRDPAACQNRKAQEAAEQYVTCQHNQYSSAPCAPRAGYAPAQRRPDSKKNANTHAALESA
ncbi:MAG TPA: transposase [Tepidisphaeraceae bacterium]|nr:transposase [Tepidisphaeraceae bacterium]